MFAVSIYYKHDRIKTIAHNNNKQPINEKRTLQNAVC